MSSLQALDTEQTRRSIERELDLVGVAIQMVAGGGTPGVTLVGLGFGPAVLQGSEPAAREAGVRLEALWHPDESHCDIRVSRNSEQPDVD
jgi:hypothetical protein